MSLLPANLAGGPLNDTDYGGLEKRWITRELADAALLRRVNSLEGAEHVGREGRSGDYSGILIPYVWPGENYVHTERIRRDHPDMEAGSDGTFKEQRKYLGPPGRGNSVYLPPQVELRFVEDRGLPAVVVEGEFKTLALWRLAWHGLGDVADTPAFLPIGLQGVFSWRGVIGKTEDSGGNRVDVKGPVPDLGKIPWSGRRVVILFDADVDDPQKPNIGEARRQLTRELEGRGAEVSWFRWPPDLPPALKGIDDFLAERGPEEVIRQLAKARKVTRKRRIATVADAIGEDDWRRELICNDQGGVKSILANAITYLSHSPELDSMLAYDEFAVRTMALQGSPWNPRSREWSEIDDIKLAEWLQKRHCHVSVPVVHQAVEAVARERSYHPVREYLAGLKWDGLPRIDRWLHDYFGVADSKYSRAVGSRWLISAVARVMEPGCQVDHCLIFEGPQGVRKSGALRALAGEWFTDQVGAELANKDSALQIHGVWIVEFAELEQVVGLRAEMATVKAFLTRRVDRFRPPFERRPMDFPRQCVFAGSVNKQGYLKDETGARRFWPVTTTLTKIDVARIERERDQLWVEARLRFEAREPFWLDTPELLALAADEAEERYEHDPWDELVWEFVQGARTAWAGGGKPVEAFSISNVEILRAAINKPQAAWQQSDKYRIGRILRQHGLVYARERMIDIDGEPLVGPGGAQQRQYRYRWP